VSFPAQLSAPTIGPGAGRVNARALDAQLRLVVQRVNELIAALGAIRGSDNLLLDRSVRWRSLSQGCRDMIQHVASLMQEIKDFREALNFFTYRGSHMWTPVNPAEVTKDQHTLRAGTRGSAPTENSDTQIVTFPGVPGLQYRVSLRIRHLLSSCWLRDNTLPANRVWTESPGLYPLPADVYVDGRVFYLGTRSFIVHPATHLRMLLYITDGPNGASPGTTRSYVLNALLGNPADGIPGWNGDGLGWTQQPSMNPALGRGSPVIPTDAVIDILVRAGDTIQAGLFNPNNNTNIRSFTDIPADDDSRFPYKHPYRSGPSVQIDFLAIRPVDLDVRVNAITTQLDAVLTTEGPGGPLEVE
jgi:hypothetical protein